MNPQLLNYINQSLSQGQQRETIYANLINKGWRKEELDRIFSTLSNKTINESPQTTDTSFKAPYYLIGKVLGLFWVIDAILQLQPKMFTADFISNVIAPNMQNQFSFLISLVGLGIKYFSLNFAVSNSIAVTIQFLIGFLLLFSSNQEYRYKFALLLSVFWGLFIWLFGEGLGNLFTGAASFYTGAPGSVLIYVIIAFILLVPEFFRSLNLSRFCGVIFIFLAGFQFQPMYWNQAGLADLFKISSSDSVRLIAVPAKFALNLISANPLVGNIILILPLLAIGLWLFFRPSRGAAWLALAFLFVVWWLCQDFGSLFTFWTGTSTDPNSAPIFAVLLVPSLFSLTTLRKIYNLQFFPRRTDFVTPA